MIETEVYEKKGLIMTCTKCFDYHKIPLQYAIPLKTMNDEEAQNKLKQIKQALKLLELVEERIRKNRGHKHYEESHDEKSICLRCSVLELQSLLEESKVSEETKK